MLVPEITGKVIYTIDFLQSPSPSERLHDFVRFVRVLHMGYIADGDKFDLAYVDHIGIFELFSRLITPFAGYPCQKIFPVGRSGPDKVSNFNLFLPTPDIIVHLLLVSGLVSGLIFSP